MSDEVTEAAVTSAPPEGAIVTDENAISADRRAAALKAGKAAAKAFAASDTPTPKPVDPVAPTDPAPANEEPTEAEQAPKPAEPAMALELRIKQREQRIREQAANKWQAKERELQEREARLAGFEQERARVQALEKLARTDPAAYLRETGIDEKAFWQGRIDEGKPEARITVLQRRLDEEEAARAKLEERWQNERAEQDRVRQEGSFRAMALDAARFPTVATVYTGSEQELTQEAYRVQAMFVKQHNRAPDLEEICINLEAMEKARAARYAKLNGTPAPAAKVAKAPRAVPADVSGRDPSDRALSQDEKKARAIAAGKRAFANYK